MRKHKACQPLSPFDTPLIFTWYRLDTPMIVTHHFQQHIHEFKCVWRYNICFWCRFCTAYIYSIPTWNFNDSDARLSTIYTNSNANENTLYAFDAVFGQQIFTLYQLQTPIKVNHSFVSYIQISSMTPLLNCCDSRQKLCEIHSVL